MNLIPPLLLIANPKPSGPPGHNGARNAERALSAPKGVTAWDFSILRPQCAYEFLAS